MEVLDFEKMKSGLHATLLSRIDLENCPRWTMAKPGARSQPLFRKLSVRQSVPLNATEKEQS